MIRRTPLKPSKDLISQISRPCSPWQTAIFSSRNIGFKTFPGNNVERRAIRNSGPCTPQSIHVPTVPSREKNGGTIYFDIFSRLLNERIIMLYSDINDSMAAVIVSQLLYLEAMDQTKPIFMYINSSGGEMHAGFSIIDTMQYIKCPVYTICVGFAASMASLILVAGEKGFRYALPNAWIMIHQPITGMQGKASDLAIQTRQILRMREQANRFYQKQLGKRYELDEIAAMIQDDNYLDPHEALQIGLIDEVISSAKQVPGSDGGDKKDQSTTMPPPPPPTSVPFAPGPSAPPESPTPKDFDSSTNANSSLLSANRFLNDEAFSPARKVSMSSSSLSSTSYYSSRAPSSAPVSSSGSAGLRNENESEDERGPGLTHLPSDWWRKLFSVK
ncbi:Clp protease-domain-containing protein [Lipomyces tetrasporus]|uniref:ATP-dependent Clp protease proteolytic subunit n=1 Tax=Lipomyces tetrasporus TaxID=54092 RepID=A0AAD7QV59_9ASCO|nr:Clp protease-domain-containing protein [Lipomyces tetrasporus]KAJ8102073.1 Clp protease-domain-containing protein [Lipomyces tetrasporus]